jgi:regulator of protease activity HflC (stomatin/prohibitin superfamily)
VALVSLILAAGIVYGAYFWLVRRVVVGPGQVLVLMKKNGSKSLPGDQIIIPRAPDPAKEPEAHRKWLADYGDVNGILEEVQPEGTYFKYSPFDYERDVISMQAVNAIVPNGKVGIVIRKFGETLPAGQVLADENKNQRGPLPGILPPGTHRQFSNPYAYEIRHVDPVIIDPGNRGVVTIMSSAAPPSAKASNEYLVEEGALGVQKRTEVEGFRQLNPFVQRVMPVSIRSHRYEMSGADAIRFPSSDSFEIRLEGFVEWSIVPEKLPLLYVQYGEGGGLVEFLEQRVILPYARSFCRLVGSRYNARDFISGETRLRFQDEFASKLREACARQGIEIMQALVRDIVPPQEIKIPINEREIAREQILALEQQIAFAKTEAERVTQQEIGKQNLAIGEANKEVVTIVNKAQQESDVAVTQAKQELEVAKLRLEAAQKQADAIVARGEAEARVVLLKKQAEAEPLRRQIEAFGGGDSYARYFYYQQVAPSVKSILSNTEGPFADLFRQFTTPQPADPTAGRNMGVSR